MCLLTFPFLACQAPWKRRDSGPCLTANCSETDESQVLWWLQHGLLRGQCGGQAPSNTKQAELMGILWRQRGKDGGRGLRLHRWIMFGRWTDTHRRKKIKVQRQIELNMICNDWLLKKQSNTIVGITDPYFIRPDPPSFLISFHSPLVILSPLNLYVPAVCSILSTVLTLASPHKGAKRGGWAHAYLWIYPHLTSTPHFHIFMRPVCFIFPCYGVQVGTACPVLGYISLSLVDGDITLWALGHFVLQIHSFIKKKVAMVTRSGPNS